MLPKFEFPRAELEPNGEGEGEVPNREELAVLNIDGDELAPNGALDVAPNRDGVDGVGVPNAEDELKGEEFIAGAVTLNAFVVVVEPNGDELKLGVEAPKGDVVPKVDVFAVKGLGDVVDENKFEDDWPNVDNVPKGFACAAGAPNTPPAG